MVEEKTLNEENDSKPNLTNVKPVPTTITNAETKKIENNNNEDKDIATLKQTYKEQLDRIMGSLLQLHINLYNFKNKL